MPNIGNTKDIYIARLHERRAEPRRAAPLDRRGGAVLQRHPARPAGPQSAPGLLEAATAALAGAPRPPHRRTHACPCPLSRDVERGWRDEGFEAASEKRCVDWINTKPDCSLEAVLKNNPDLAERLKKAPPTNWAAKARWEKEQDHRRGKFI